MLLEVWPALSVQGRGCGFASRGDFEDRSARTRAGAAGLRGDVSTQQVPAGAPARVCALGLSVGRGPG
jgi:hypothetical protein